MKIEHMFSLLSEMNPEALTADGFDEACIGYTSGFRASEETNPVAVYDRAKCLRILVERDGMTEDEAEEFFSFNTEGAFVGMNGPIFVEINDPLEVDWAP